MQWRRWEEGERARWRDWLPGNKEVVKTKQCSTKERRTQRSNNSISNSSRQTTVELKFNFNRQKEQKEQSAGENEKQKGESKREGEMEEETNLSIDYTHTQRHNTHAYACMYINPCICTYVYNGDNGVQTNKFSSRQRQLHAHTRTHI